MTPLTDVQLARRVHWRFLCQPERCVHNRAFYEAVSPRLARKRCRRCGTVLGEVPRCPRVTLSGRQCLLGVREDSGFHSCMAHTRREQAG